MNNNSKDVVKNVELNNVESTSNEQRQTNKPIVISRRRLLRAGVAGIPVVLTMAGVAPGQGIMGQASAASGLVYGGTGVGVRERFDGTDKVYNNLVWSNNNGFVIDKENEKLFTEDISTISRNNPSGVGGISLTDTDDTKTKAVTVTPKEFNSSTQGLHFNAYLHKTGAYYTDFVVVKEGGTAVSPQEIADYFRGLNTVAEVTSYFDFTLVSGETGATVNINDKITDASVTNVNVTPSSSWTQTTGYELTSEGTRPYYLVPGSSAEAFTVTLKVEITVSGYTETINEGTEENPQPVLHTYECTSKSSDEIELTFTVEGKSYSGN